MNMTKVELNKGTVLKQPRNSNTRRLGSAMLGRCHHNHYKRNNHDEKATATTISTLSHLVPPTGEKHTEEPLKRWNGDPVYIFGQTGMHVINTGQRNPKFKLNLVTCDPIVRGDKMQRRRRRRRRGGGVSK